MNKQIILIITAFVICACNKTYEKNNLVIQNETNSNIEVNLYPKNEFIKDELYNFDSKGNGYSELEFELGNDSLFDESSRILFQSEDIGKNPAQTIREVFDSIHVKVISSGDTTVLKFSSSGVSSYKSNMFLDNSEWLYEFDSYEDPTKKGWTDEVHVYTFQILNEEILR